MKIKHKFAIGFIVVFSLSFIMFNTIINSLFNNYVRDLIREEMNASYRSSYRITRFYLQVNGLEATEDIFSRNAPEISMNISEENNCQIDIYTNAGAKTYTYDIENENFYGEEEKINELIKKGNNNQAVMDIYTKGRAITSVIAFPLYIGENYLGTMALTKDFSQVYNELLKFLTISKTIVVTIFFVLIIVSYVLCGIIVKPLINLKDSFKEVAKGNYDEPINITGKDEIGELAKGFNSMKEKIKAQITTINEEKEKVLALEKTRTEFFNNVTHELKTPLTTISGYGQILQDKDFNDKEFHDYALERIEKESIRMHNMVVALIEVSKDKTKIKKDDISLVNIKETLQEIINDISIKGDKYNILLNSKLDDLSFVCVEDDMRRLFINLVDNAVKYSVPNKQVNIKLKKLPKGFKFEVENFSEPITTNGLENIFEPFYREDVRKSRELGSNGLGLYISSQIVEKYGGTIDFKYENSKVVVEVNIEVHGA